jgi:hypothetical protein
LQAYCYEAPAARRRAYQAVEKRAFHVILNKVKDLNRLKTRDSSLRSE